MFQELVIWLRELIGIDMSFETLYHQINNGGYGNAYVWDYGAMIEYVMTALVVLFVLKFIFSLFKR